MGYFFWRDGADFFALDVEQGFVFSRADSYIRPGCFARAVDYAAHHRDRYRLGEFNLRQCPFDFFEDGLELRLQPAACWAGDEFRALSRGQAKRCEQFLCVANFRHRVAGVAYADGLADALAQQRPYRRGRPYRAGANRAGVGNAQVCLLYTSDAADE